MTALDPRVGEIEARLSAATRGPWEIIGGNEYLTGIDVAIGAWDDGGIRLCDAEFIANAPADVAYLLAELRKAREALGRVEEIADLYRFTIMSRDIRAAVAAAKETE